MAKIYLSPAAHLHDNHTACPMSCSENTHCNQYMDVVERRLRELGFEVRGIGDAAQCQVHRGGVDVSQVSSRTLQLSAAPSVRVVGEALDVDAPCGGYNLHWAWASGLLAARSAIEDL